jgi:hypothetical protein
MRVCGRRCGRFWSATEREYGDGEEKRFGQPEGVVRKAVSGPGAENGSGQEAETDEAKGAGLGEAIFAGLWGGVAVEGIVEAFGHIAEVSGDEGGVVSEAVDAAEAGDLDGGDVGDDAGEGHLGEASMEPAENEDGDDFEGETEDGGADAEAGTQMFGGDDAGEEGDEGYEMRGDIAPVAAEDGDAEEDDVPCHGVGEDMAVVEVDDGVEKTTCARQEHGLGECAGLDGGVVVGHGGYSQRLS